MKKYISAIILAFCFVVVLLPATALASDTLTTGTCGASATWSYDQATKTLTISGSGTIELWDNNTGSIFPWQWRAEIEKVEFNGNFTAIGNNSFQQLSKLESITIPNGVTSIGNNAFWGCTGLTHVTVPASVTQMGSSFFDSPQLKTVGPLGSGCDIEVGWTDSIPDVAFNGCDSITQITIPEGVTSIGRSAFFNCTGLTEIIIPEGVISIDYDAFNGCPNLAHVVLPASLTIYGSGNTNSGLSGMFAYTKSSFLTSAGPKGSGNYAIEYGWADTIPTGAFSGLSALTQITFSDNVKTIGDGAFSSTGLTQITIPSTVTTIGNQAFAGTGLIELTIPASVTKLGYDVFGHCQNLSHVVIQADVSALTSSVSISNRSLYQGQYHNPDTGKIETVCPLLTSVGPIGSNSSIEIGWSKIPAQAFAGCIGIKNIFISDVVTEIGDGAFANTGLTELTIPATVTKLGYNVFGGCSNLSHVVIQADDSTISPNRPIYEGQYYNSTTGKTETNCPLLISVGSIGSNSNIEIGWDTIPAYAFAGCVGLQTISIPDTVKTIGNEAFNTCEGVTKITIPNTVTTIGSRAISYCPKLKELQIPASVIRINNGHDGMFGGCTGLENITVDPTNTVYASQDGALVSKEKATLYCVPQGKSGFTIPTSVTTIGAGAFYGCANLPDLTIPSSVTAIGYDAFSGCAGLTKLIIPDSVTSSSFNFYGCTALTEVTLPGTANYSGSVSGPSLTTVRISEGAEYLNGTFSNLTTLTTVYLPASLKGVGPSTFANCSSLKNIYFAGTQAQWDTLTIADGNQELSLATVICTGTGLESPVDPADPNVPDTLDVSTTPGSLGQKLTVQIQSGHWLTIQTRRAGSIAISSIQAPVGAGGVVSVTFSAPAGSIVQIWETENELTFVNGVPTNTILKTVVKQL